MVVYSTLYVGGSLVSDSYEFNVNKSIGDNNSSSSFEATLNNVKGVNKNNYTVGDEVIVYADKDINPPTTKIFTGILEDKDFSGQEQKETLSLTGRDYSARLQDRTVEPEVYTSLPAGSIVKDIVSKYVDGITVTNVQNSTTTIDRISYSHTPVFDAIKKLADLAQFNFYVDVDKDLHFEPKSTTSCGYTFDNTNIMSSDFRERRDTLYNQIWVYGDRYLDGFKETFTANGGSSFTLLYNPHNTSVTVGGSAIQPGAIEGITSVPISGVKYMVNYNDKNIIFVSGTSQGNFIPTSGNSVVLTYDRSLPIVKVGDNEPSKTQYGTRVKVIQDKDIKDPATAEQILARELDENSIPKKEGSLEIRGVVNVTPGQTCIVNIPFHQVNNQTYDILEAVYDFNDENNLSNNVLTVKVNKKLPDITDTMKEIMLALKKLQAQDLTTSDTITRYQYTLGSFGIRQSGCFVYTRGIGSAFILGHPENGLLGSYTSHTLGDWRTGSTFNFSGGYF